MPEEMIFNTGGYLRVSREDGEDGESDSISNQRFICKEYIENHSDLRLIEIYDEDDGYSGTNMERPGIQRLFADVRSGKINCIVCKDLSRFSRNYIDAGKYLEKVFPALNVRFIAINDMYDSISPQAASDFISLPFKNLVNDIYCRDISIKIRSNLRAKRKRGEYVGAFVPYGYRKAERNKNQLVVDDDAAEIVKKIFGMYKDGYSIQGIADKMNLLSIPTPLEYKKLNGMGVSDVFRKNANAEWNYTTVSRILKNDVYIGRLTQGRYSSPNHKVHMMHLKKQEEWITVEEAHEAIIKKEEFNQIQCFMKRDTRAVQAEKKKKLFSGFVFCGDCKGNMIYRSVIYGEKRYPYLICSWNRRTHACSQHSTGEEQITQVILHALQAQMISRKSLPLYLEENKNQKRKENQIRELDIGIQILSDEITDYRNRKQRLLSDMKNQILSKEEFEEYNRMYSDIIMNRENKLINLRQEAEHERIKYISYQQRRISILDRKLIELNRRILAETIDKILVFEGRCMEISFRYKDRYIELLDSIGNTV